MHTISDIIRDIDRGCEANNMVSDKFSYRIIFFVNEGNKGSRHYLDTMYGGLRKSLEGIIRGNLSLTNGVVIARTTALKDGKCISLQSRPYAFSLNEYFRQVMENCNDNGRRANKIYGKYAMR